MSPELSELVVYTRSVPFKSFEHAAKNPPTDMCSFSESEALRLSKDSGRISVQNLQSLRTRVLRPLSKECQLRVFLVLLLQGCILYVSTATRSAGSTHQVSAFSRPTTTLRRCGTLAVKLVRAAHQESWSKHLARWFSFHWPNMIGQKRSLQTIFIDMCS